MRAGIVELNEVEAALDALADVDFSVGSAAVATDLVRRTERLARKMRAVQVRVQAELDSSQVYRFDGYASAKAMVRQVARLSPSAAAARARAARMARDLPELAAAMADGALGVDQSDLLARVHANPRVRDAMVDAQGWFLRRAERLSFTDFEAEVRRWERLADIDGAEPANSRNHVNRDAQMVQDPVDLGWELAGGFGALQGAAIDDIFRPYVDAERLADWEKARAELGDTATAADLPRTEPQRRADALWQIFQDAATSDGSAVGVDFVHQVVWDHATFEEMLRRLTGEDPQPLDPETSTCRTLDGTPLEPTEAAVNALVEQFRRVVVDAAGVVTDLGRARRFTGNARLAAQLPVTHCVWPGCPVPTSSCEVDHSLEHGTGGRTNPANGAPLCGRHNRWKQKGFRTSRDPTGQWHTYRSDGTEIG